MGGIMELTWFGTAGFRIKTGGHIILIDPYLTRNEMARPEQPHKASDIHDGNLIFISHGHFDHIMDIPEIVSKTEATIYCGEGIDDTLIQKGVKQDLIQCVKMDGEEFEFNGLMAQSFFSRHVKFDRRLLFKTLTRINLRLPRYLPLLREYPEGQVLSWRFKIEDKVLHHFGSAGSTSEELDRLGRQPTDILLVPLQGHTHIVEIALKYVKALLPKVVIPHHQDNFYPPISTMVNLQPFVEGVPKLAPGTEVRVLEMNQTVKL
jgi:L-ascorbate metabolism protein UlaG (beta-lactamase superfamily)